MRLNGDWHGWGLTILLVAAFSLYKWAQAFRQCHPFLQFCSSYARSTIEHFCNQANCWHPNIHPFNLLWPPFLRRCMESTCWFPNLSSQAPSRQFELQRLSTQHGQVLFQWCSEHRYWPRCTCSTIWALVPLNNHWWCVKHFSLKKWGDWRSMYLALLDRLVIIVFVAEGQIYKFAKAQFLLLNGQKYCIEFVLHCLVFFRWRFNSLVEIGKYISKWFVLLLLTFGTMIIGRNRGGRVVQLEQLWRCLEGKGWAHNNLSLTIPKVLMVQVTYQAKPSVTCKLFDPQ